MSMKEIIIKRSELEVATEGYLQTLMRPLLNGHKPGVLHHSITPKGTQEIAARHNVIMTLMPESDGIGPGHVWVTGWKKGEDWKPERCRFVVKCDTCEREMSVPEDVDAHNCRTCEHGVWARDCGRIGCTGTPGIDRGPETMPTSDTTYVLPQIPLTQGDRENRRAAATGSVAFAQAAADADYNGHPVRLTHKPHAIGGPRWTAEYYWGERVVLGRGDFARCLLAAKREYQRGARGCLVVAALTHKAAEPIQEQEKALRAAGFVRVPGDANPLDFAAGLAETERRMSQEAFIEYVHERNEGRQVVEDVVAARKAVTG